MITSLGKKEKIKIMCAYPDCKAEAVFASSVDYGDYCKLHRTKIMSDNKNCDKIKSCNHCSFCRFCDSCEYCFSCAYCELCENCYECKTCNFCYSCYSCFSCSFCDYCKGLYMSEEMIFCLGNEDWKNIGQGYQKNYRIFNRQLTKNKWEAEKSKLPIIELPPNRWINEDDMTKEEKKKICDWKEAGGYLKKLSYEEAWKHWWKGASKKDKDKILNCKYFDADIFNGITGINLVQECNDDKKFD